MAEKVKTRHRGVYRRGPRLVIWVDGKFKTLPVGTTLEEAAKAREKAIGRRLDDLPRAIPPKPKQPRQGFVYVAHAPEVGRCKIGWSEYNPETRVRELQIGSPVKLVLAVSFPGTIQDERRIHRAFAAERLHGEWFAIDPKAVFHLPSLSP